MRGGEGNHEGSVAALRRARRVVGLYGDPQSTWGIAVELGWSDPVDPAAVAGSWRDLALSHPHLGAAGDPRVVAAADFERAREEVAAAAYLPGAAPVRVLITEAGDRLVIGAHHGIVDGLGLLALGEGLTGRRIVSAAHGIGERAAGQGFLRSGVRRVGEAVLSPPGRFPGSGETGSGREDLRVADFSAATLGSASVGHAALSAFNSARDRGRVVLLLGASRRPGDRLAPDRATAYLRLRPPRSASATEIADLLRQTDPEPDFPETAAGGLGPLIVRLLRARLGATALISNLGVVSAAGLQRVAMFPAPSGPRAVALGLASTAELTTLTLRTQRSDFTVEESDHIFTAVCAGFTALGATLRSGPQ